MLSIYLVLQFWKSYDMIGIKFLTFIMFGIIGWYDLHHVFQFWEASILRYSMV